MDSILSYKEYNLEIISNVSGWDCELTQNE